MTRFLDTVLGAALLGLVLAVPTYFLSSGVTKFITGVVILVVVATNGVRYVQRRAAEAEAVETAKVEEPAG